MSLHKMKTIEHEMLIKLVTITETNPLMREFRDFVDMCARVLCVLCAYDVCACV